MADTGEASTAAEKYTYGGGGGGGKVRKERKPPSTPYDRPSNRRWISRLVDPAKRLFSGFPSLFSYPSSTLVDETHTVVEEETRFAEENRSLDPVVPESTGGSAVREDKGKSKLVISDEDGFDKNEGCSSGVLPGIEQLIKGKTFSREELDHLMKILRARVVDDVEQDRITPIMKGTDGVERVETSNTRLKSSLHDENFQLPTSTPLPRPTIQDGIGASPVDIAKAYMGSRMSEMGFTSTKSAPKTEKLGFINENLANSIMSSPLQKSPICWPGVITQNQQDYSTPPNRNYRSSLRNFSRTPYSRTVYSKSKSKLNPLGGDNEGFLSITPAPFRPTPTPFYEKVQSMNNVTESSYGTGGPIRRTRDKFSLAIPTRDSPLFTTARKSPSGRESTPDIFPKKTFELGSSSKINFDSGISKAKNPDSSVRSVHPHSNRLALKILEQLDKPITLKEHAKELTLAVSQKDTNVENNTSSSKDAFGVQHSGQKDREKNVFGSMISGDKPSSVFGIDNGPSPSFDKVTSQRSSEQGITNNQSMTSLLFSDPNKGATTITNNSRSESQNSQRKPVLPSIAIEKPGINTSFSSITSPGFTFPVTTSSITSSEPPTPSVIPSILSSSPPNPKSSTTLPTFNFGNKITIAPPVVAYSSKMGPTLDEASGPKFKFGSEKPRLSFAVVGADDTLASTSDGSIPKFKFGSGEGRLNFGSDALCC